MASVSVRTPLTTNNPRKVSDCKNEDMMDKIKEDLASIASKIHSNSNQVEEIQERLQSIHEFIMQLAEEKKELKEKVTVLETQVKKLKQELESLKSQQNDILIGEVVKGVERKIIELLGGDGSYVSLNHVVQNLNNSERLIGEQVFLSEDEVKEADRIWKKLKEQYKLENYHATRLRSLRKVRNQRAHPEIGTAPVTVIEEALKSTTDKRMQEVLEKLVPIIRDHGIIKSMY